MTSMRPARLTWGDGDRCALLVHGLSSNARNWWRLGPDLAALGYTVVAPDLRGHGGTGHVLHYAQDDFVADAIGLGDRWDLVLGHSLGGFVVLATQIAHPEFARALILEDPWIRLSAAPEVVSWLLREYDGDMSPQGVATANPRWHPDDAAAKSAALADAGPAVVKAVITALDGIDMWEDLATLTIPTLLIGADPSLDALVSAEQGMAAAGNPLVSYEMIDGATHGIHRDSYPRYLSALAAFVGTLPPSG